MLPGRDLKHDKKVGKKQRTRIYVRARGIEIYGRKDGSESRSSKEKVGGVGFGESLRMSRKKKLQKRIEKTAGRHR